MTDAEERKQRAIEEIRTRDAHEQREAVILQIHGYMALAGPEATVQMLRELANDFEQYCQWFSGG